MPQLSLCIICLLLFPIAIYAHGDLHERIVAVSKEIKNRPDSAFLYLKRGELYYQHEEPQKAIQDFVQCQSLGFQNARLNLNLAKSYFSLGKNEVALPYVNRILEHDSIHVNAYRLKGQILAELNHFDEAAIAYERVIRHATQTIPENYLEAASAWEKSGDDSKYCKAMAIIENGIDRLGKLRSLYNRLIELNLSVDDYGSVLKYQTEYIQELNRKEFAYVERAKTYMLIGEYKSARNDLLSAQESIKKLNPRIQKLQATQNLITEIKNLLNNPKIAN